MKVEIKPVSDCKVNIAVTATSEETKGEYKKVFNMFVKQRNISGFRKGKAPKEVIQKTFGAEISKETESCLCRSMYKQAVEEADIKLVSVLNIENVRFAPETGIEFIVVADVEPEFKLPKYKGIAVKPQEVAVTEEELDDYMERMRSAFAKFEEAPEDYVIQENDLVCIDFTATADGKPVKEVASGAEQLSEGTDFWVQTDEKQFVPQVVKDIIGLKAGDEKKISFKFEKSMPVEELRGLKAVYEIKVKSVRKRIVPDDKELCIQVKTDSLDDFRKDAKAKMLETAEQNEQKRRRQVITEHLLKKASFGLPESELADSVNNILDQMMREAQMRGMKPEDLSSQREAILKTATVSATSQVRMKYIIRDIAAGEGIEASKEEVDAKLGEMSKEYNMEVKEIRKRLAENKNEDVIRDQVIFDKTIDFLLAEAK